MLWIIVAALLLGTIITIHEFGHYLAACACGVKAEVFSIGIGPRIVSWQSMLEDDGSTIWRLRSTLIGSRFVYFNMKHRTVGMAKIEFINKDDGQEAVEKIKELERREGTEWILAPILIYGYVQFKATPKDEDPKPWMLEAKPLWQRIFVDLAGPAMNLITAVIGFTVLFSVGINSWYIEDPVIGTIDNPTAVITSLTSELYEGELGLSAGDQIVAVNGIDVATASQVYDSLQGDVIGLTVLGTEDNVSRVVSLDTRNCTGNPERNLLAQCGVLKVKTNAIHKFPVHYSFALGVSATSVSPVLVAGSIINASKKLMNKKERKKLSGSYVGVTAIVNHVSKSAQKGWADLLSLAITFSLFVGWGNLLPIPPLDGGQIVRQATEKVAGPRLKLVLNHSWVVFTLLFILMELSFLIWSSFHDLLLWLTS